MVKTGPHGRAFYEQRVGMNPRGAWEIQKRGKGDASSLKKEAGSLSLLICLQGLHEPGSQENWDESPLWLPPGVGHSFTQPHPWKGKGRSGVSDGL